MHETWVYEFIFHLINNCWCILPICISLKKKGLGYSHPPTTIKPPVSKFDIWLIYSKVTCDCVIFNIKFSTTKFSSLTLPKYSRYNWIFEYFVNLWVEISEMVVMRGWVTFLIRSSQPLIPCCRGMEVCPSLLEYIISMTHRLPTNSCQNIHFYFLQIFFYFHLIHQLCIV